MRKPWSALLLVVFAFALSPGVTRAASVDITLELQNGSAPAAPYYWSLGITSTVPVVAIAFEIDGMYSFQPSPGNAAIDVLNSTYDPAFAGDFFAPGRGAFAVNALPGQTLAGLLGTFASNFNHAVPLGPVAILPNDAQFAGENVFAPDFTAISDYAIHLVPEPSGQSLLVALLIAAAAAARLRARDESLR